MGIPHETKHPDRTAIYSWGSNLCAQFGRRPRAINILTQANAEWCDRFWCLYMDIDAEPDIEELMPIFADVDKEWDIHLACKYSIDELHNNDFEYERMPNEWFDDWLSQLQL